MYVYIYMYIRYKMITSGMMSSDVTRNAWARDRSNMAQSSIQFQEINSFEPLLAFDPLSVPGAAARFCLLFQDLQL